jgi:hypothetical protein
MRGLVSVTLENSAGDVLLLRLFGATSTGSYPRPKIRALTVRSGFLLNAPIFLNVLLNVLQLPGRATGIAWLWLVYFSLCSFVILVGMATGWPRLIAAGPVIDDLVPTSNGQRQLAKLLCAYLRQRPQMVSMVIGGVSGAGFLLLAKPSLSQELPIGLSSYLAVATTGALAGAAAHWVIGLVHFALTVQRSQAIAVRWIDPARTPGIVALAAGYTYGAPFGAAGLALGALHHEAW